MKNKESCLTCHYFIDTKGDALGVCRRYPPAEKKQTRTKDTDWCGEYKPKNIKK